MSTCSISAHRWRMKLRPFLAKQWSHDDNIGQDSWGPHNWKNSFEGVVNYKEKSPFSMLQLKEVSCSSCHKWISPRSVAKRCPSWQWGEEMAVPSTDSSGCCHDLEPGFSLFTSRAHSGARVYLFLTPWHLRPWAYGDKQNWCGPHPHRARGLMEAMK